VCAHLDAPDADDKKEFVSNIAKFAIGIIMGSSNVQAERTSRNQEFEQEAPPVKPLDLVAFHSSMFISDVLEPRNKQLPSLGRLTTSTTSRLMTAN
jgi:hypothetical protein